MAELISTGQKRMVAFGNIVGNDLSWLYQMEHKMLELLWPDERLWWLQ